MPKVSAFLAAFLAATAILPAETPDTATIHGRVVDQSHAGVAGVTLTATNTQTGLKRVDESDAAGDFSLAGLPIAGAYTIAASKAGFADATLEKVTLSGDTAADLELQLNVAGGQSQITVTGVIGEVRTDEPQLGALLDAVQMDATPLLGNKITNLPMLSAANRPAISKGDVFMNQTLFTTNGAGRRQAWFEVDGSNAIDAWGRQTLIPSLPRGAVQEMDVLTNAFSAEYGGSTGSVINIISRSGGSQLHGRPRKRGGRPIPPPRSRDFHKSPPTRPATRCSAILWGNPIWTSAGRSDRAAPLTSLWPASSAARIRARR